MIPREVAATKVHSIAANHEPPHPLVSPLHCGAVLTWSSHREATSEFVMVLIGGKPLSKKETRTFWHCSTLPWKLTQKRFTMEVRAADPSADLQSSSAGNRVLLSFRKGFLLNFPLPQTQEGQQVSWTCWSGVLTSRTRA